MLSSVHFLHLVLCLFVFLTVLIWLPTISQLFSKTDKQGWLTRWLPWSLTSKKIQGSTTFGNDYVMMSSMCSQPCDLFAVINLPTVVGNLFQSGGHKSTSKELRKIFFIKQFTSTMDPALIVLQFMSQSQNVKVGALGFQKRSGRPSLLQPRFRHPCLPIPHTVSLKS